MKKAALHELYTSDQSSQQLAVVIPLHPERKPAKSQRKRSVAIKPVINETTTPLPVFTTPVFKPKKHDMF
jgi:hypothetical protein